MTCHAVDICSLLLFLPKLITNTFFKHIAEIDQEEAGGALIKDKLQKIVHLSAPSSDFRSLNISQDGSENISNINVPNSPKPVHVFPLTVRCGDECYNDTISCFYFVSV